jgi:hypothetical protein
VLLFWNDTKQNIIFYHAILSKKINPKSEKMKILNIVFQLALSQEMSLIENQEMLSCPTKNDPNLMCTGWNLKFPGLILCAYIPETVYFSAKSNFDFNKGQDFQPGFNCMNVRYQKIVYNFLINN